MSLKKFNTILAAIVILFVFYLGILFILVPEAGAPGVGLPTWPEGDGGGFLVMKGTREFSMGLVLAILLMEAVAPRRHDQRPDPPRVGRRRVWDPRPDRSGDRGRRPAVPLGDPQAL